MKLALLLSVLGLATVGLAQDPAPDAKSAPKQPNLINPRTKQFAEVEREGVEVRVKDIARFRGVRANQLQGYGLVVGLEGSGDSKKTPFTATLLANAMKKFGTMIDPNQMNLKNVATVSITAELPPFSSPGNRINVTVQSIGDAKSLQGGTLLQAPLYGAGDDTRAIAVAQGPISIGGFNSSSTGSSVQKNHVNVGMIPGGAFVETSVPTQVMFNGRLYLELDEGDLTTAQRLASKLSEKFPNFVPIAMDGGTIEISVPAGASPVEVMSLIESTTVFADVQALVVVNERTGTIVMGGNLKLGPAVVAQGNLEIMIERDPIVAQPLPLSNTGTTTVVDHANVGASEDKAQFGSIGKNATVADLARVFQAIKATPRDIISILQALRDQGALKARIKLQ